MTATAIVGWALIHFLWQGALVGGAAAVLLAITGRRAPAVRYGLSVAGLLVMGVLPLFTAARLSESDPTPAGLDRSSVRGNTEPVKSAGPTPAALRREVSLTPEATSAVTPGEPASLRTLPLPLPGHGLRDALEQRADRFLPWLVGLWLAGVAGLALRLLGGWARTRHLTRIGTRPASDGCRALADRLARQVRLSRPVRLLESTMLRVPAVIGWLRPVLLLPVSLTAGLTPQQLEVILAHELAHVRRHDYAVNLLQAVLETLLFYHPAVWWLSRRIREEREHCCDDLAVAVCGDPRLYAGALLQLEHLRGAGPALAPAATGGSLLRRVRRLLAPPPSHAEAGHRWVAGLGVLALVLAAFGGAALSRPASAGAAPRRSPPHQPEPSREPGEGPRQQGKRSLGPPAPDTVIRHPGSGPLAERWRWATEAARRQRFPGFWIGYAVSHENARRGWLYFDRQVPVSTGHGSSSFMSGRLRFQGQVEGLRFSGIGLDSLVGPRDAADVALFFGFVLENGRPRLDRIHLGNFLFPVHFGGRALIWLGGAADRESVDLIRELYAGVGSEDLREDLVAAVGAHTDPRVVVPAMTRWLESDEPERVRAEAAEALGYQDDAAALAVLARTAREDRSSRVRAEAAEAVGALELPAAADTLVALARTLTDQHARREAVESLGQRKEKLALEALIRIAREDPSTEVQREAVETLGDVTEARGVPHLLEIARSHPRTEVRREAVETLGHAATPDEALRTLQRIAREDRSPEVQREAVETLGQLEDARVLPVLLDLARTHPVAEVQRGAVETLGELDDPRVLPILIELARQHPRAEVQRVAIETFAEHASPDSAVKLLAALVRDEGSDPGIQHQALEALAQLDDGAGVATLIVVARSHPNRRLRVKAIELLGESDDSRAKAELERLLGPGR